MHWCHVPHGSAFGRPFSLSFFSNGRNPILPVRKSFVATPLFIALHSSSPRYRPLVLWEVTPGFLLFLLDLWYLRRMYPSFVSCVLLAFPLSCLNPLLVALHASGIPSLWQPPGILTQLSFYIGNFPIFWSELLFTFSCFLIGFQAYLFFFMIFGLQAFWAYHLFSFFYGPLCLFLWAWVL